MTLADYRKDSTYRAAIELGPKLMNMAEELPASEEMGLSLQLRQLMVELPASVAGDLTLGTGTRHAAGFKLLAVLELIDKVYPALDTAATRSAADKLVEEMVSAAHAPAPAPAAPKPAPAPAPRPHTDVDPASVPVEPSRDSAPRIATVVPVTSEPTSEETHVQSDSVQQAS